MLLVNGRGTIVLANRRAVELFGYSREELVGSPVGMLVPEAVAGAHAGLVEGFFSAPAARAMGAGRDLVARHRDGTPLAVEIGLDPVPTEDGVEVLASIVDIRARKLAEAKLTATLAELARSNRELDQFAYVASHDLRAPLRDVDNLVQWIAEDLGEDLPEATARHVGLLRTRVRRMEALLEDLLAYSRAGRVRAPSELVDLSQVVRSVFELLGPRDGLRLEVREPLGTVQSPRAPLEVVLRNLIGNAIKHHDRPSEGTVVVASEDAAGPFVTIRVSDDGPGIPPELHERAFAMFQTLKPRDEVEGTGMGLALVERLVTFHGGTIHLDSAGGRGCTFRFTWPRHQA